MLITLFITHTLLHIWNTGWREIKLQLSTLSRSWWL